jgi:hypothetical protein
MAIEPFTLKYERVRPPAPLLALIQVPLSAANRLINQRNTAGKSEPSRAGVTREKFLVGKSGYLDHFALRGIRLHRGKPL